MGCGFEYETVSAGLFALEQHGDLLPKPTLDSIRRNGVALKGPLTTPVGKGFRSVNVTLRELFDLYANVRPVVSFPGTRAHFDNVDIITEVDLVGLWERHMAGRPQPGPGAASHDTGPHWSALS